MSARDELTEWFEAEVGGSSDEDVLATVDAFLSSEWLAAHDAAVRESLAVAVSAEVVRMQREVMSGNYQDANEIHEDLGRIAAIARGDA